MLQLLHKRNKMLTLPFFAVFNFNITIPVFKPIHLHVKRNQMNMIRHNGWVTENIQRVQAGRNYITDNRTLSKNNTPRERHTWHSDYASMQTLFFSTRGFEHFSHYLQAVKERRNLTSSSEINRWSRVGTSPLVLPEIRMNFVSFPLASSSTQSKLLTVD